MPDPCEPKNGSQAPGANVTDREDGRLQSRWGQAALFLLFLSRAERHELRPSIEATGGPVFLSHLLPAPSEQHVINGRVHEPQQIVVSPPYAPRERQKI